MNINIYELTQVCPDVNITLKAGELLEMAEYLIKLTRQEFEKQVANANVESYLSRDEVAEMLGVDKSTLWRWNKQNYLKPIEVGGKRKYKMSDVKQILGENKNGSN